MSVPITPRFNFPEDEKKYYWLPMILDAYHAIDSANSVGIPQEEKKRAQKLACHKGCSNCCLASIVPVSIIELSGISWYCTEQLNGPIRTQVKAQLTSNYTESLHCPFLVEGVCSIYPIRPIACRQFHVFGTPCLPKEDALKTRPQDIWSPGIETSKKVLEKILPYYGITSKSQQMIALEEGWLLENVKDLFELDLSGIHESMLSFEQSP
jgi:Fe-S-cluster containining protein